MMTYYHQVLDMSSLPSQISSELPAANGLAKRPGPLQMPRVLQQTRILKGEHQHGRLRSGTRRLVGES